MADFCTAALTLDARRCNVEINATTPLAGGTLADGTAWHPAGAYTRYPYLGERRSATGGWRMPGA